MTGFYAVCVQFAFRGAATKIDSSVKPFILTQLLRLLLSNYPSIGFISFSFMRAQLVLDKTVVLKQQVPSMPEERGGVMKGPVYTAR